MAGRDNGRGRGSAILGQLIVLAVLIPVALLVVFWVTSPNSPFSTKKADSPLPVVIREIRSANQLITAKTEVDVPITGKSSSMLPGSEEKIIYYAVYDVTAGVDLSKIKDSDITIDGDTVRIVLPAPEILSQSLNTAKSHVLSHDIGPLATIGGTDQTLMDQVLATANQKAKTALLTDNRLLDKAKTSAQENIGQLLTKAGVKKVVFVESQTTPTPLPNLTPSSPQ